MIKAVVSDLDGTLLNSAKKITAASKEALNKLKDRGVIICLASGRPYLNVAALAQAVGLADAESYLITNTGAFIHDFKRKKVLKAAELTLADYHLFAPYVANTSAQLCAYGENELYTFAANLNAAFKFDRDLLGMKVTLIDTATFQGKFARLNLIGEGEAVSAVLKMIPKELLANYYTVRNVPFILEILNKDAGKAQALKYLANYLHLDLQSEVLVIGDGYNDLEMLKTVGNSVAMGQSPEAIRRQCKYVTTANDEEGFATIVEQVVFKD